MATKSLAKLKAEMIFNSDLTRLVDVMKGIAASQYHVMEHKRTIHEKIGGAIDELFQVYDFRFTDHPFLRMRNRKKLICLVTTDGGFLGGLNMKVSQAANRLEDRETKYLVLGERGASYLREFGKTYTPFPGINPDETRFQLVDKVVAFILQGVLTGTFGHVVIVYPHSTSFTSQRVESLNLIPCPMFFKNRQEIKPGEIPNKGVILESTPWEIIEYLTALWLRKKLIEAFEFSKLSEYGARVMHLESSYNTLTKIDKQLKLQFFKARREKIDQSLRETFTSQLVCKD